jgi:hypothetical protein
MFLHLRSVFNRVFLPSRAARKHLGPVVIENLPSSQKCRLDLAPPLAE